MGSIGKAHQGALSKVGRGQLPDAIGKRLYIFGAVTRLKSELAQVIEKDC